MIITDSGLGSGTYLGSNAILTNAHVVGSSRNVGVLYKPQQEGAKIIPSDVVVAKVVRTDIVRDLALLSVTSVPAHVNSLQLGNEAEIQVGADVHAIGHPTGEAWTYTRGLISQFRRNYEWKTDRGLHTANVIQTQTPINPGNSGGPLIGASGMLLGVNSFKEKGEGLNFAVSVGDVATFLSSTNKQASSEPSLPSTCKPIKLFDGRNKVNDGNLVQIDTRCRGAANFSIFTPDNLTRPILALIDTNDDGQTDIIVEDRGRNGQWNFSFHDVDYDGTIDLVGFHPDGKIKPSRFEKYNPKKNY